MKKTNLITFGRAIRLLAVLGLCLDFSASAALLLQEGFNYPNGILGNNSPWTAATSLIYVTNNSLAYSNLATISPNNSAVVTPGTVAASYRPIGSIPTSGTVYYSCLINFLSLSGSYYITGLTQATNSTPGGSGADPLDLVDRNSTTPYAFGIRGKGVSGSYGVALNFNTTYFLVLKYNSSSGAVSLYLNPAPGGTEPVTPYASNTGASVQDLTYLYLRSGGSTAGTFSIGNLRVGTTWNDVTPIAAQSGVVVFTAQPPAIITAGTALANVNVQLQDGLGNNLASNNVPVKLILSSGSFATGTTTVNTDSTGLATFSGLVVNAAGTYTLTASANGYGTVVSSNCVINPAAIDHYTLSSSSSVFVSLPFVVSGMAVDTFSNLVTTDNSTVVTLGSSTGNVRFDGNKSGVFGQYGDNLVALDGGTFNLNAEDGQTENVSISASDANGKTGISSLITVISNGISANGAMLNAFLDSLQVDKYWLVGTSVNWLTGAPGGSGPNMTLGTDSHCSAFAGSACEMLGVYILRPPDVSDLDLANHQADWFVTNTVGWVPIATMVNAQHMADTGMLVMASYKSSSGSGHIALLRASNWTDNNVNATGPEECQSGTYNFADTNIMTGFNQHSGAFPNNIKYYGHIVNYPISPVWPLLGPITLSNLNFTSGLTTIVGRQYQLQWSPNLMNWSPLMNFTNSNSPLTFFTNSYFSGPISGPAPKFYRLLAQ
jgi:hypothetical protein